HVEAFRLEEALLDREVDYAVVGDRKYAERDVRLFDRSRLSGCRRCGKQASHDQAAREGGARKKCGRACGTARSWKHDEPPLNWRFHGAFPLIPAQAGIQHAFSACWVPAFAGTSGQITDSVRAEHALGL